MKNYAVAFRAGPSAPWQRWTVRDNPVDALHVLDHLLDDKQVYGAAVSHTTDPAAPGDWEGPLVNDPYNRHAGQNNYLSEPCTQAEVDAARRAAARNAVDVDDLAELLDMLGIGPNPEVRVARTTAA